MKKIKIVHITSSLKMGGAEQLLCDLIKSLDHGKFEQEVIYFHDGPHRQCLEKLAIPHYQPQSKFFGYDPLFFYHFYQTIKKIKPHILHTNLWAANNSGRLLGALLAIPVVSVLHNYLDQDGWLKNKIDHLTVKLSEHIIAFSPGIMESLIKREKWHTKNATHDAHYSANSPDNRFIMATKLPPCPTKPWRSWKAKDQNYQSKSCKKKKKNGQYPELSIFNIGIDIKKLHADAQNSRLARAELNLADQNFVIGTVGRFVEVKRYEFIIETFKLFHNTYNHARLLLVGTGPLEQALRLKVAALNLNDAVIFEVNQPGYAYYQLFDCFILASEKEGPSLAMLEAMSFGVPIIRATIEKEHPIIKNQENGLLIDAYDAHAVVQAYTNIMNNTELARQLGNQGRKDVFELYDLSQLTKSYENFFYNIS